MLKKLLLALSLVGLAWGQPDFTNMDITSMYNQQVNQNNAYFQQLNQATVQANMQNPRVRAMYRQYQAQGGQASFEQFCYMYGATGGFSGPGIQNYYQTQQDINAQQQRSWQDYQQAQAQRARAQSQWQEGYRQHQQQAGTTLQGQATYTSPAGTCPLPYTWQPGYHQYNSQTYYVDNVGQYYQVDPSSGWLTPIYRSP